MATDANDKNARLSNVVLSMTSPAYVCTIKAVCKGSDECNVHVINI